MPQSGLAGRDPREHLRRRRTRRGCRPSRSPMSATRSMTSRSDGGSNCTCTGSPAASLTAAPHAADVQGAPVRGRGAAGGQRRVHRTVEVTRGDRDLGEHRRRLLGDRAARGQRDPDAAERALVAVAPVGAGLQDGAGHGVQVQQRDLPVGDAVGGRQVVVLRDVGASVGARPAGPARRRRPSRRRPRARRRYGELCDVGRAGRNRRRHALDVEHPGVGRPGPAGPRSDRDLDPQAVALQRGDQLLPARAAAGRVGPGGALSVMRCPSLMAA